MRGINHNHISTRLNQCLGALETISTRTSGRRHQQPAPLILRGQWMILRLFHILDSDQANAIIIGINNNQLFNSVFMQQPARLICCCAILDRDHSAGHQVGHFLVRVGGKAHIPVGQNAHQFVTCLFAINNRDTANAMRFHHRQRVTQRFIRGDRQRVDHHAGFKFFHLGNFCCLFVNGKVFMHHTNAASLCHRNCQTMFGDRIHGRRHQRNLQADGLRQARGNIGISWQNSRSRWFQQDVVKGKCVANFHGGCLPLIRWHRTIPKAG